MLTREATICDWPDAQRFDEGTLSSDMHGLSHELPVWARFQRWLPIPADVVGLSTTGRTFSLRTTRSQWCLGLGGRRDQSLGFATLFAPLRLDLAGLGVGFHANLGLV